MLKDLIRQIDEPENAVLSLGVQAQMGPVVEPERSQFELLVRHMLDRFLNNDMVSAEGETKKRLVLVAAVIAVPQLIFSLFMYPPYHGIYPQPAKPPFWSQVIHHYFYVLYPVVVMGAVTVFEWEMLFPELLDVFVLSTLPIANRRLFWARISALGIFLAMFLMVTNSLGTVFFPVVVDLPGLMRHLFAHAVAVSAGGVFTVAFFLVLQGLLIVAMGQRLARAASPLLQGVSVMLLLTVLILCPLFSMFMQPLLESNSAAVRYFPPFWFLGIYERLWAGPEVLPVFDALARTGVWATVLMILLVIVTYPLAYRRRTRQLIEGSSASGRRRELWRPVNWLLHAGLVRAPRQRAIYHFINQTLLRTQRHRVYLAMYGGVGIALMIAGVIVIRPHDGRISLGVAEYGLRAAIPMLAFWAIAGLRMALVSNVDQRGGWIFGIIHGRPQMEHLAATKMWVFLWGFAMTLAAIAVNYTIGPETLRSGVAVVVQIVTAVGLCLLLTDAFFMKVKVVPFTRGQPEHRNMALVVIPYLIFFPLLVTATVGLEGWMEESRMHVVRAVFFIVIAHLAFKRRHGRLVNEEAGRIDLDDAEPMFQGLGLRDE
jgi:hypothetical protein